MADIADIANDTVELVDGARIAAVRSLSGVQQVLPTGVCLFCDGLLTKPTTRWCDAQCRDDWELERKAHERQQTQAGI